VEFDTQHSSKTDRRNPGERKLRKLPPCLPLMFMILLGIGSGKHSASMAQSPAPHRSCPRWRRTVLHNMQQSQLLASSDSIDHIAVGVSVKGYCGGIFSSSRLFISGAAPGGF
jgi:hypothetical protein